MRGLRHCRVLVVDMTHGGPVLCGELLRRGCAVHCLDNHGTLSGDDVERLKREGIEVHREVPSVGLFDVIVVQHADPSLRVFSDALEHCVPIITHARAVGIILGEEKGPTKIIEVTGTNGKTTTCNLLAKVLSDHGLSVLIHDSTGTRVTGDGGLVLAKGLSITPANLLRAWRLAGEKGVRPDVCVFEVSLGGTGAADIGVVTGIYENYRVPLMVNAFGSKLQMALHMDSDGILVLNGDNGPARKFAHVFRGRSNLYGFEGNLQVRGRIRGYDAEGGMVVGGEVHELETLNDGRMSCPFSFRLGPQLFGRHQALNALAALATSLSMGLGIDSVCASISGFEGVEGRSKATLEGWGLMVECRGGMNLPAVASVLSEAIGLKRLGKVGKVVAVIGGSERSACGTVDADRLAAYLRGMEEVDLYLLYGPLGARLEGLGVRGHVVHSLEEALLRARSEASGNPKAAVVVCENGA